jgi:hypothetical protein
LLGSAVPRQPPLVWKRHIVLGRWIVEREVMGLSIPKTASLLFLIFLLALAGSSPVFGVDGAIIELTPPSGCPNDSVIVYAEFPSPPPSFTAHVTFTSAPYGLLSELGTCIDLVDDTIGVSCPFTVPESACARACTVTASLTTDGTVVDSVSASFEVPSTCGRACAVGGGVQPVNKLTTLSPWLAVIGLVGCISAAVVVAKKRQS